MLLGLTGVERDLLLALDGRQRPALIRFQFVERGGAHDQFPVLLRTLGGVAGGQPVVEGFAGARRIGALSIELELRLIELLFGGLPGLARLDDDGPGPLGAGPVDEILKAVALLDLGQIGNDLSTQPDQKTAEQEGHQPQPGAEPLFGQPQ